MNKILKFIVELISWIAIFLSPVFGGVVVLLILYSLDIKNLIILGGVFIVFVIIGVVFAEIVRRKHGCSNYLSRIYG